MNPKRRASRRWRSRIFIGSSVIVVGAGVLLFACVTGGPVGFVPGGRFAGEIERGPEPDWDFAAPLDTVGVQVNSSPPRTGIVVYEGIPYLPVTYAPFKRWQSVVKQDPRVILRADGRLFERTAIWIADEQLHAELVAAGQAKYGPPFHASWTPGITEFFRLEPRQ